MPSVLTVRAAVGALLVTVALLGVSQAYAHADRPPSVGYVVARHDLPPGSVLDGDDVDLLPAELPETLAARAFTSEEVLDGSVTLAPLAPGELVLLGQVLPAGEAPPSGVDLSFAIEADRALAGSLRSGEVVDLLASAATGPATRVARGAQVVDVASVGDSLLADAGQLVLTVRLREDDELLDVVAAVDDGQVTVVRPALGGAI
jgi:hypothetical protein